MQLEQLQSLDQLGSSTDQGEGGSKVVDYFNNTVEKFKREVDMLMKCAEQIMALPGTKHSSVNNAKQTP